MLKRIHVHQYLTTNQIVGKFATKQTHQLDNTLETYSNATITS